MKTYKRNLKVIKYLDYLMLKMQTSQLRKVSIQNYEKIMPQRFQDIQ